jgi:hypothetical protein
MTSVPLNAKRVSRISLDRSAATDGALSRYTPPRILSVVVAPDITKCMQNTGGTVQRSTFQIYKTEST